MIKWFVYDIHSESEKLNGVMLRGRIRKYGIEQNIDVLAENAEDRENGVRFAVTDREDVEVISQYVGSIIIDAVITEVLADVQNPVLSKLKVNQADRYAL